MNLNHTQEILNTFSTQLLASDSQLERLQLIIDWGDALPPLPTHQKTPSNKVPFCASDTFIKMDIHPDKVIITADSGAYITKGYLYILTTALSGLSPQNLLKSKSLILKFASKTGLSQSQLPARANTFSHFYHFITSQISASYIKS